MASFRETSPRGTLAKDIAATLVILRDLEEKGFLPSLSPVFRTAGNKVWPTVSV